MNENICHQVCENCKFGGLQVQQTNENNEHRRVLVAGVYAEVARQSALLDAEVELKGAGLTAEEQLELVETGRYVNALMTSAVDKQVAENLPQQRVVCGGRGWLRRALFGCGAKIVPVQ